MNKLSTILLSSLFLAQLTACGDDGGDDTGATGTDTSTGTDTTSTGATTSSGTTSSSTTGDDTTTSTTGETEADSSSTTEDADTDTDTAGEPDTDTDTDSAGTDTTDPGDEEIPPMCMETCDEDEDCYIGGADVGLVCLDGQCGTPPCEEDADCFVGGFDTGLSCVDGACIFACEETIECQTIGWQPCGDTCFTACIEVGDEERCALLLETEEVPCTSPMIPLEVTTTDGETVTACVTAQVCGDVDGTSMCVATPCNEEGGSCAEGWTCNEETGTCFQCSEDTDCEDGQVCYEGSCLTPCGDPAEDCQQAFDGTELTCE